MASPPEWLSRFVDVVTANIHAHNLLSPLGCHFQRVNHVWEITLFASHTEVIGGQFDGSIRHSPFGVNVKQLLEVFTSVESISWQTDLIDQYDELGAHLSIEGVHENEPIWLRITAKAPDRFSPGRRALVHEKAIEEVW